MDMHMKVNKMIDLQPIPLHQPVFEWYMTVFEALN
jgi:hypothetical protein